MIYKPSMFNYRSKYGKEMIIYNSLKGLRSVSMVSAERMERICQLFEAEKIEAVQLQDLEELVELGFFVPYDFDEKLNRNRMQMEYIMSPNLQLVIHTTKDCNFRCKYCALDFEPQYLQQDECDNVIAFLRRNISKYQTLHIGWFGGEPLLGMKAIERIGSAAMEICRRAKKPYASSVTTNGYLLTPENLEKLLSLKVYHYSVTIDGLKSTHDNQRVSANGEGSFDKIMENLEYMRDHIALHALRVIIRTNVTKDIYERIEEYYDFFNRRFGKDRRFSLFVRPAGDWGGERVKQFSGHLIEEDMMNEVLYKLSLQIKDIKFDMNYGDLDFAGSTCPATKLHKYTFGCDGLVTKCDTCSKELSVGKLESGKMEIDTGKENQWVLGHRYHDEECDNCFFSGSCFLNACPKEPFFSGKKSCINFSQIDSILQLYVKSYQVRRI